MHVLNNKSSLGVHHIQLMLSDNQLKNLARYNHSSDNPSVPASFTCGQLFREINFSDSLHYSRMVKEDDYHNLF